MNNFKLISLGNNCPVKYSIRELDNKQLTYPFDWILTHNVDDIINVLDTNNYNDFIDFSKYKLINYSSSNYSFSDKLTIILNQIDHNQLDKLVLSNPNADYNLLFEIKKLVKDANNIENYDDVANMFYQHLVRIMTYKGITLVHDHHINIPWSQVTEKYHRRFARFFELKNEEKILIFIRSSLANENYMKLYDSLTKNFSNFYLLCLFESVDNEKKFIAIKKNLYTYHGILEVNKQPFHSEIISNFLNKIVTIII